MTTTKSIYVDREKWLNVRKNNNYGLNWLYLIWIMFLIMFKYYQKILSHYWLSSRNSTLKTARIMNREFLGAQVCALVQTDLLFYLPLVFKPVLTFILTKCLVCLVQFMMTLGPRIIFRISPCRDRSNLHIW